MVRRLALSLAFVGSAAGLAGAAPVPIATFEPETCTLNLAPSYPGTPTGVVMATLPVDGVLSCPPGVPIPGDPSDIGPFLLQSSASGAYGPVFGSVGALPYFDPSSNAIFQRDLSYLLSSSALFFGSGFGYITALLNQASGVKETPQGTYDRLIASSGGGLEIPPYIDDGGGKYYRVVLRQPVQIVPTTAGDAQCTVNLAARYAWKWNAPGYWVVPDSAVKCNGFAFNSAAYSLWMEFNSRQENQGVLYTASRDAYDPATKTYAKRFELRLSNNGSAAGTVRDPKGGGIQLPFGIPILPSPGAGTGAQGAVPGPAPVWGRFMFGTSSIPQISRGGFVWRNGLPQQQFMQVNLSRSSFAIKRATSVTLKATKAGPGKLRFAITADRNASFQNASVGPTYRRQTVLPSTPADHAVLKRGSKVIKRVKLSPYGKASVVVKDPAGRNAYSATMVETNDNFVGSARVVR